MTGSALEWAIADGVMVREPSPPPDFAEPQKFAPTVAMAEWLISNTIDPTRFDTSSLRAVLREVFPEASEADLSIAARYVRESWFPEATRSDRAAAEPPPPMARPPSYDFDVCAMAPAPAYGKAVGLNFMIMLVAILLVVIVWAVS